MDKRKALQLEKDLKGKHFSTYEIIELLDNGKSAAVFKGKDSSHKLVAIKIFDNALIERFGYEIQEKRIEQEMSLVGHTIPNLIKIVDGGKTQVSGEEFHYIVMEFNAGKNLKRYIELESYDNTFVKTVAETLFHVSESLLVDKGLVHRDIKPENIMIGSDSSITLMDLGVLKLIGGDSFSDQDEKQFVSTLRYAPPELLERKEEDSPAGWRAVNLYQIGGVLHDLLMKKELFQEYTPYTKLVFTIKEEPPKIENSKFPYDTIQITRNLLIKDWHKRLSTCSKEKLETFFKSDINNTSTLNKALDDLMSFSSRHNAKLEGIENIHRTEKEKIEKRKEIAPQIEKVIDNVIDELKQTGLFPSFSKSHNFVFNAEFQIPPNMLIRNFLYEINGNINHGFPQPLYILVRIENDETYFSNISFLCMFIGSTIRIDIANPAYMFAEIYQEEEQRALSMARFNNNQKFSFDKYDAFTGTVNIDQSFKDKIKSELVGLISTALKDKEIDLYLKEEIERREKIAKKTIKMSVHQPLRTKLFFEIK